MYLQITSKLQDTRFVIVEINGEIWKEIYKPLFIKHFNKLRRCVDQNELELIWPEIEKKAAEEALLKLLTRRSYFSEELRQKLKLKKLSSCSIEHAIDKYQQLGYIDDEREADSLVRREKEKGRGPRLIAQKLKRWGLPTRVSIDEKSVIEELLKTALRRFDLKNPKERQKAARALLRRGFNLELITSFLYKDFF